MTEKCSPSKAWRNDAISAGPYHAYVYLVHGGPAARFEITSGLDCYGDPYVEMNCTAEDLNDAKLQAEDEIRKLLADALAELDKEE